MDSTNDKTVFGASELVVVENSMPDSGGRAGRSISIFGTLIRTHPYGHYVEVGSQLCARGFSSAHPKRSPRGRGIRPGCGKPAARMVAQSEITLLLGTVASASQEPTRDSIAQSSAFPSSSNASCKHARIWACIVPPTPTQRNTLLLHSVEMRTRCALKCVFTNPNPSTDTPTPHRYTHNPCRLEWASAGGGGARYCT